MDVFELAAPGFAAAVPTTPIVATASFYRAFCGLSFNILDSLLAQG